MEYHLKGLVDSWFGVLERRLWRAAQEAVVNSGNKLLAALSADMTPGELLEGVWPAMTRDEYILAHPGVRASSFPLPVRGCYHYDFQKKDRRSVGVVGQDGSTLTGVKVRAFMFPAACGLCVCFGNWPLVSRVFTGPSFS